MMQYAKYTKKILQFLTRILKNTPHNILHYHSIPKKKEKKKHGECDTQRHIQMIRKMHLQQINLSLKNSLTQGPVRGIAPLSHHKLTKETLLYSPTEIRQKNRIPLQEILLFDSLEKVRKETTLSFFIYPQEFSPMTPLSFPVCFKQICVLTILLTCSLIFRPCAGSASDSFPDKKIMLVHSYEPGQVCGQPQADGILSGLAKAGFIEGKNLQVEQFFMDTKRNYTTAEQIEARGALALKKIQEFNPDLVITIDDNAAKTVMLPLAGTETPVVFCGINNQPENYNQQKQFMESRKRPGANVTGVYEKLHITKALDVMHAITGLQKAAVIVDGSPSGDAVKIQIEKEMASSKSSVELVYYQVASFEEFKHAIRAINKDPDTGAVYPVAVTLQTRYNQPVTAQEIFSWLLTNSKKPEMAANYFFSRLGMFGGVAVDFLAMGEQAGQKAAAILQGLPGGDIPIDDARDQSLVFNLERARQLGINIPIDILSAADILYEKILLQPSEKPIKLLIVQSYEQGVGCGATIEKGFIEGLAQAGFRDGERLDLYHYHMNTQHKHITETAIKNQAQLALAEINELDPQLVVLMDDNAFEYVLPPLVGGKYPVLFGGTNVPLEWYNQTIQFMDSREKPGKNVTGITEEHELLQNLRLIKSLVPDAETAVIIYSASTAFIRRMGEANEAYIAAHREQLPIRFIEPVYVTGFSEYQTVIDTYSNAPEVDLIYTFAPVSLVKEDESISSVQETVGWMARNQKKPGFTWMTDWVGLGYLASAGIDLTATGKQLAEKARQVIKGTDPGTLPIDNPSKYSIALNLDRARQLGLTIPVDILEAAESVYPATGE